MEASCSRKRGPTRWRGKLDADSGWEDLAQWLQYRGAGTRRDLLVVTMRPLFTPLPGINALGHYVSFRGARYLMGIPAARDSQSQSHTMRMTASPLPLDHHRACTTSRLNDQSPYRATRHHAIVRRPQDM